MDNDNSGRVEAWHAVFEELCAGNPSFSRPFTSGMEAAVKEIRRLYRIERALIEVMAKNARLPQLVAGSSEN